MYGYYGRNSQDLECCKCFENVAQTSRNYMYSYLDFRRNGEFSIRILNPISKLSEFEYRE